MKITVKNARTLREACAFVTSGTKTIVTKLANGDQSPTSVAWELDDKARWNLTKNLELAERIVTRADKQRESILRELSGGRDISKKESPDLFAAWQTRTEAVEEIVESAPFLKVKLSGLKISNTNAVPGVIVVGLRTVLDEDMPATDAADVIKDDEAAE